MPDSDENYPKAAAFIKDWYGQLGIKLQTQVLDSATLTDLLLPPEAGGAGNLAKYDIELWGWSGNPDPNGLLQIFKCDAIGGSSDSNYCNKQYDSMYEAETKAKSNEERKPILAQMQNLIYDQAVYDILYYDSNLDAYRTDRFAGWRNQPSNGTPLFSYGVLGYTLLTDAKAVPSAEPSAAAAPGSSGAAPSAGPSSPASTGGGGNTPLLVGVAAIVVAAVAGVLFMNRRRARMAEDEE